MLKLMLAEKYCLDSSDSFLILDSLSSKILPLTSISTIFLVAMVTRPAAQHVLQAVIRMTTGGCYK